MVKSIVPIGTKNILSEYEKIVGRCCAISTPERSARGQGLKSNADSRASVYKPNGVFAL